MINWLITLFTGQAVQKRLIQLWIRLWTWWLWSPWPPWSSRQLKSGRWHRRRPGHGRLSPGQLPEGGGRGEGRGLQSQEGQGLLQLLEKNTTRFSQNWQNNIIQCWAAKKLIPYHNQGYVKISSGQRTVSTDVTWSPDIGWLHFSCGSEFGCGRSF